MALYKRNNVWWISINHGGKRIQRTTGTQDKIAAKKLHDKIQAELWDNKHFCEKPKKIWTEAVIRWLAESQHKRSLRDDKMHLRWLDPHLKQYLLSQINRETIESIAKIKEETGVQPSTVNRMLALIRAILKKAEREWEWIDKAPIIRMRHESKGRIRWLTKVEACRLINTLPEHLASMAAFTLATGLRQGNVTGLEWSDVDLERHHALVHPDQAKAKKAIPIPLNANAVEILKKQIGKHEKFVFSYGGERIVQCSTKAWRKALERANISNFRWHDLRHTWASWHVQSGTSLHELQQLGGWASYDMVLRYAHLSSDHLKKAAERVTVTNLLQSSVSAVNNAI